MDTQVAEASSPTNRPPPLTPAERMRRHRERRKRGLRCTTAVLNEDQLEGLIQRGWLGRDERGDAGAVRKALACYLGDNLGQRWLWR
jgi:hypothetical protein